MKTTDRLTAQQIVDDFFHEYCEGRLDREEMVEVIKTYARQCIDAYDRERISDVHFI